MNRFSAVILAAGQGTRMKSERCKVLHEICSKPLLRWVYDACTAAGSEKTVMVIGHKKEEVVQALGDDKCYAVQNERKGTGHAVQMAQGEFQGYSGTIVVLNGDTPLISAKTIQQAVAHHVSSGASATVLSAKLDNPAGYGRIVRDLEGKLRKIVEQKDADDYEKTLHEVNSGMYCFDAAALFEALSKVQNNNAQGEYYLTDTIAILKEAGKPVEAYCMEHAEELLGVNDREGLAAAQKIKQAQINRALMASGVTMIDPDTVYCDDTVQIGCDTILYPNVVLKGSTVIGKGCVVELGTTIENSTIGDRVHIKCSVVLDARVGDDTTVGPFAYIRPNSSIGAHVRIGDFVEIKNSSIDDGTKVSHLTYVGDSDVGKRVNFGCGTVTVNYDGKQKHRTTIGDDAFIGCNTNLVAPVTLGNRAFTAAGSTITDDVEEEALAIARSRQVVKSGWRKNK